MSARGHVGGTFKRTAIAIGILLILTILGFLLFKIFQKKPEISSRGFDGEKNTAELHMGPAIKLSKLKAERWVKIYNPQKAFNGFSLAFIGRRIPMVIDMNGNILHAWPRIRAKARMMLSKKGHLIYIGADNVIREVSWCGKPVWEFHNPNENDFPHHDLIVLRNGNFLALYHNAKKKTDYFWEINRKKKIVWEWKSSKYINKYFKDKITNPNDLIHINSVQELPMNKWYGQGDQRFKPGNLLVSARNLNTIFIIEKDTRDVVWQYSNNLDYQHEAIMVAKGLTQAGKILIFNNGFNNYHGYRKSTILKIDPISSKVIWEYSSKYFFSKTGGIQQVLSNGNLLISSSQGGRVFEIDPAGKIVWQWVPPYSPMRFKRYAYDYCSPFKNLNRHPEREIYPQAGGGYIDKGLCRFVMRPFIKVGEHHKKKIKFLNWQLLGKNPICRRLIIPPRAFLHIGYGLDKKAMTADGVKKLTFHLKIKMKLMESKEELVLLEELAGTNIDKGWIQKKIPLNEYSNKIINLCLELRSVKGPADLDFRKYILFEVPDLIPGRKLTLESKYIQQFLNNEKVNRKSQLRELKTMGYVE